MCTKNFKAKNGFIYQIYINEIGTEIKVSLNREFIGGFSFRLIEGLDGFGDSFKITHMEVNGHKGYGVGTRCLKFHKDIFRSSIIAGSNDGSKSDDGSYLVGDGPIFIDRMRTKGLVDKG